jgi:FMN phosphatase YigB (HAD superfamily)
MGDADEKAPGLGPTGETTGSAPDSAPGRMSQGLRLLRGLFSLGGRFAGEWQEARALDSCRLLSLDVFDTLLLRVPGAPRLAEYEAAAQAARLAERRGAPRHLPSDSFRLRARVWRDLASRNRRTGRDPDVLHSDLVRAHLSALLGAEPRPEDVEELLAYERALLLHTTRRNDEIADLITRARDLGLPVVAVSDTYLSASEIGELLVANGVSGVDRVYSSSEKGRSKFTGRLFSLVLESERSRPSDVLHIGDNFLADVCSPRALGIRTAWYRGPRAKTRREHVPTGLPEAERASPFVAARGETSLDRAFFDIGLTVLGPVLCTFAHHVLLEADRAGHDDLLFVARDGDLLHRVTTILAPCVPVLHRPSLRYTYLSRRSTALPALPALDPDRAAEMLNLHAANRGLAGILAALNLSPAAMVSLASRHGILRLDEPISRPESEPRLRALLGDPRFRALVEGERARQKDLLRRYLSQEGLFSGRRVALVDVGWSGTTQSAIIAAFAGEPGLSAPYGLYVGLGQDPLRGDPDDLELKKGLLSDFRRGRSLVEASAHYATTLLEAVCRAAHGTVLGYEESAGGVAPILHEVSAPRGADEGEARARMLVRNGVEAYARQYAGSLRGASLDEAGTRRRAQHLLLRLAFFPTPTEMALARLLTMGDVFSEDWRTPLLPEEAPRPWSAPRAWLSGLKAPWRAAYVAATGGLPFAVAFAGFESVLLRVPPRAVRALRRWALAAAGRP